MSQHRDEAATRAREQLDAARESYKRGDIDRAELDRQTREFVEFHRASAEDDPAIREADLDRFIEYLETEATDEQRELYERIFAAQRAEKPGWRLLGLFGLKPRVRISRRGPGPPPPPDPVHPPGYPLEGVFAAREDQITAHLVEHGPGPDFTGVEWKRLGPIELAELGEIIGGGNYVVLEDEMTETHSGGDSSESGLFRIPRSLRDALASLTDVEGAASRWAATQELQLGGATPENLQEPLTELRDLAREAQREAKDLWVWWML